MSNEELFDLEEKLEKLLKNMDVPAHRKVMRTIHNYKWLYKNLETRNKENSNFSKTMDILSVLVKEKK